MLIAHLSMSLLGSILGGRTLEWCGRLSSCPSNVIRLSYVFALFDKMLKSLHGFGHVTGFHPKRATNECLNEQICRLSTILYSSGIYDHKEISEDSEEK